MDTFLAILGVFGGLSGWALLGYRLYYERQRLAQDLDRANMLAGRRAEAIDLVLARYRELHQKFTRQLVQARVYFAIEEELATRLAEATDGSARTCKVKARKAVEQRMGEPLNRRITSPDGIQTQLNDLEQFEETIARALSDIACSAADAARTADSVRTTKAYDALEFDTDELDEAVKACTPAEPRAAA